MKKQIKPLQLQYAGCYDLHLYCNCINDEHSYNEFPHQFVGKTFEDCSAEARSKGWKLHLKTRTATCPKCKNG